MRAWLRVLGLALAFAAMGVAALHDYADADESSPAHHCCLCHSQAAGPNPPAAAPAPAPARRDAEPGRERTGLRAAVSRQSAPRGPPAS